LGKRAGKDADRNKATLVPFSAYGSAQQARRLAQHAIQALEDGGFGDKALYLRRRRCSRQPEILIE